MIVFLLAEVSKGTALRRKKHVAFKRTREGVRINDSIELELKASGGGGQDGLPSSAEIQKAEKALKLSSLELRAMVKDPLPEALRYAETLSHLARDNMGHQPAGNRSDRAPPPMYSSSRLFQASGDKCEAQHNFHQSAASKPDQVNQNTTANPIEVYASKKNFASTCLKIHSQMLCFLACIDAQCSLVCS